MPMSQLWHVSGATFPRNLRRMTTTIGRLGMGSKWRYLEAFSFSGVFFLTVHFNRRLQVPH